MASTTKDNWSATKYDTNANFVPVLGATILGMLDPKPTETILDLGCGDGVLTKDLEKMCAHVVGVDASANMIEKAKDLGCKDARVVDGHDLVSWFDNENIEQQINGKFDAVFSNAGKRKYNPSNMSCRHSHVKITVNIFSSALDEEKSQRRDCWSLPRFEAWRPLCSGIWWPFELRW